MLVREYPRAPAAATFEITPQAALIWAYAPEPTTARIEIWTKLAAQEVDEGGAEHGSGTSSPGGSVLRNERIATHYIKLLERTGRTGALDVTGLEPGRQYRYRLHFGNGRATGWYTFRTAPLADSDAPVHFVVGADISNDPRYGAAHYGPGESKPGILDRMSATGADFFVSLGDWPYTDIAIRDTEVAEYRSSHRVARLETKVTRLLKAMPVYAIYNDHELRDNWDETFRIEEPERFRAGLAVWDEFFPLRGAAADPLTRRRYRTVQWGKHVQLSILDTRRYRSPYRAVDGPDKSMLGAEQKRWLRRALRSSRASFKIVLTSVPLAFGTTKDHWSAYAVERDALLDYVRDRRIRGVVFITADQHWFAAHHHPGGIREFQVGPLAAFVRTPGPEQPEQVVVRAPVRNYGEIIVTPGPIPRLVFTARDRDGTLIYAEVVEPS